ncbi:hypothetical protein D3Z46_19845 [Bacteroides sartorii]|jgi:hypothetical protein|nr:hypothetical protein [Phocaeicola sartorii]
MIILIVIANIKNAPEEIKSFCPLSLHSLAKKNLIPLHFPKNPPESEKMQYICAVRYKPND